MKGIVIAAAMVVALMAAVKDHRLLQHAGLAGGCTSIQAPKGDTASWRECHAGRISGMPDLSRQSCTRAGKGIHVEFWRCPASVESGPNGR
jgi:hypothetical protein